MSFYSKKPKLPKTKKQCQTIHAKNRGQERFGLTLCGADLKRMVSQIQFGAAKFVEKKTNRISIFLIMHQGVCYKVAYDKKRKQIASILP